VRRLFTRKSVVIPAVLAVVLAVGGIAYAYFTSSGSGSGSASVGSAGNDLVVTGTTAGNLYPGGPAGTVSFTVANGSNFNQRLSNIHLVSIAPDGAHASCATVLGTDFSMPDVPVGADGNIAPGATAQPIIETGSLSMLDSGVSQDGCQGATLTLTFITT
jgi:hypothetical protein